MLKIWGRLSSINVRKVMWAVQWLNLEHERIDAGGSFGVVQTPSFMAHNPNAMVPLIQDGDFYLWESNVIVRYLCAKQGYTTLYPQGLYEAFDAERWMDWQQTTLNPAGRDAFMQLIRRPNGQVDQARVDQSVAATVPLLILLDKHLAAQPFLAGAQLTMADIPVACEIHRWRALPLVHAAYPNLDRWYEQMLSMPASNGVLDIPLS
jgi:glutathione S-transferase